MKPGGYMLAFSAARTYHQLASNIELAGFEIRDQLMWLYGSGFPKAQDIGKAIQKRIGVEQTIDRPDLKETGRGLDNFSHNMDGGSEKESGVSTVCTSPIAKEWEGYKTALKPAHEPIVMARKPFKGSTIDNVLKNGLGAMNIDATRVPWADAKDAAEIQNAFMNEKGIAAGLICVDGGPMFQGTEKKKKSDDGRRVRNEAPEVMVPHPGTTKKKKSDRELASARAPTPLYMSNILAESQDRERIPDARHGADEAPTILANEGGRYPSNVIGEVEEGYQKYFYCPKVSRKERHVGFETEIRGIRFAPEPSDGPAAIIEGHEDQRCSNRIETTFEMLESVGGYLITPNGQRTTSATEGEPFIPGVGGFKFHDVKHEVEKIRKAQGITATNIGNNHPTVKPVALMEYLIKLVTPPSTPILQRKVLDPFMGSGSTGMATTALGHHFTGCDLDERYVEIAQTRIEAWNMPDEPQLPSTLFGT